MKTKLKYSIQLRLSVAFALISLLAAAAAGGIAFYDTYHETHDLQDSLLRQTAAYIRPDTPVTQQNDDDNDAHLFIQTAATPADQIILPLPENISDGLHTLTHKKDNYRVFIKSTPQGRIAVLQDNEYREDLAVRAAWNSAVPLLALVPLITLLTIIIMRRTLRPVRLLSLSVENRTGNDLTPLNGEAIPTEIRGFIIAINRLLERTHTAMQQQQRFIADAAHELRSPMTALSLQVERLGKQSLPESASAQVAELQKSLHRNQRLLEQLLSLARAQAAEPQPHTTVAMQPLMRRVIEDILPLADAKDQDIGVTSTANPGIRADETDLYTLIKTLADNAIRYTPAGSRIDLSAEVESNQLVIRVEDNGSGIPPAERKRVFDPFYRILGSGEQGTGLGLPIADTIAKRYGGRITLADSPNFPSGLLVTVSLPLNS